MPKLNILSKKIKIFTLFASTAIISLINHKHSRSQQHYYIVKYVEESFVFNVNRNMNITHARSGKIDLHSHIMTQKEANSVIFVESMLKFVNIWKPSELKNIIDINSSSKLIIINYVKLLCNIYY